MFQEPELERLEHQGNSDGCSGGRTGRGACVPAWRPAPRWLSLRAEPNRRTFWTLSAWADREALQAFARSGYHRSVMLNYRDRMAGSHFHTWTDSGPDAARPTWDDAMRRYDASTTTQT
jgi:hypothetical protein